nr:ATP-binding protein [Mesorhizobium intechi]
MSKSVFFCTLAELIAALARPEREGRLQERIRFFCRPSRLVVDEIGYLPLVHGGGNLFSQLVNARYEKGALIPQTAALLNGRGLRRPCRRNRTSRSPASPCGSSSSSKDRAIGSASTPSSCPNTCDQKPPSRRRH